MTGGCTPCWLISWEYMGIICVPFIGASETRDPQQRCSLAQLHVFSHPRDFCCARASMAQPMRTVRKEPSILGSRATTKRRDQLQNLHDGLVSVDQREGFA